MPAVCAQAHIFAPNITSSAAFPQEKVAPLSDQIAVPPFFNSKFVLFFDDKRLHRPSCFLTFLVFICIFLFTALEKFVNSDKCISLIRLPGQI